MISIRVISWQIYIPRCFITSSLNPTKCLIAVEEYLGEEDALSSDDEDEESVQKAA